MVQGLDFYVKSSRIELRSSHEAMRRLLPLYVESVRIAEMDDAVIGEVSLIIRAVSSALDKIANAAYVQLHSSESTHTYFPIALDTASLAQQVSSNFGSRTKLHSTVFDAFQIVQPFNEGFDILAMLKKLYRVHSHRGFELHESAQHMLIEDVSDGVEPIDEDAINAETWPGVTTDRRNYLVLGANSGEIRASVREDWYFEGTEKSVMGTLLELHNVSVTTVGIIANALGEPIAPDRLASLSIRLRPISQHPTHGSSASSGGNSDDASIGK